MLDVMKIMISIHRHHQMVNSEIRLIIFFASKDGEALYSQQKQDQELAVAQIMNFFKRSHANTHVLSALHATTGYFQPTPLPETPGPSQASLGQSLVGPLLLSPGSSSTQSFVCALQESASQSCVSSGSSMVRSVETSSKRAYAIPRSTAPRAPKTTNCGKF